jgi:transcriptional regulator with XRE-family HTH domain
MLLVCQAVTSVSTMKTDAPGGRLAKNVQRLRKLRGLTVRDLSARLTEVGHPVLPSVVSKTELGQRRVDVDDLVALAVTLGVTPNRLLLPGAVDDDTVMLTPNVEASQIGAWWWATGEQRLPGPFSPPERQFIAENRPHDPPDTTTVEDLLKLEEAGELDALRAGYAQARAAGLELKSVINYLRLEERRRSQEELMQAERNVFGRNLDEDNPGPRP